MNRDLTSNAETWETFAKNDPLWAILTDAEKAGRKWSEGEFFATGRDEIATVLNHLDHIGVRVQKQCALDFGCGVGRLTKGLAEHFAEVHGVDISKTMVEEAQRRSGPGPGHCHYHLNTQPDLRLFRDSTFDLIYSSIVLQHIPIDFVKDYLREFVRILKPGGFIVFQMPARYITNDQTDLSRLQKLRNHLRIRTRLRTMLAQAGLGTAKSANEMQMNGLPEETIREIIQAAGARTIDVQLTNSTDADFNGQLRYLSEPPVEGWISNQYCVTK